MDLAGEGSRWPAEAGSTSRTALRAGPRGLDAAAPNAAPRTPEGRGDSFADPSPSHSAGATHAWDSCAFRRADRDPLLTWSPWGDNAIPRRPPHQCLGTRRPWAMTGPRNFPQDLRRGPMAESAQGRGSTWSGAQCVLAESVPTGSECRGCGTSLPNSRNFGQSVPQVGQSATRHRLSCWNVGHFLADMSLLRLRCVTILQVRPSRGLGSGSSGTRPATFFSEDTLQKRPI